MLARRRFRTRKVHLANSTIFFVKVSGNGAKARRQTTSVESMAYRKARANLNALRRIAAEAHQTHILILAARFARGFRRSVAPLERGRRECRVRATPAVSCADCAK